MRTRLVAGAVLAAFVAGGVIGGILFLRPQRGLGYDRGELRRLQDQAGFGLLLPARLPAGYEYWYAFADPGTAFGPTVVFRRPDGGGVLTLTQAPTAGRTTAAGGGEEVAVQGTRGWYLESGRDPSVRIQVPVQGDSGASRAGEVTWTQDEMDYALVSADGLDRDGLLKVAASLKPLDDLL